MIHRIRIPILFVICWGFALAAYGQSIETLREQIRQAEEEIRITSRLLDQTQSSKKLTQSELKLIQNRIKNRKKVIAGLEAQIRLTDRDINTKTASIGSMQQDLERLKADYAAMIRNAYKNYKLNNFLVFLFASKDFNDATKRIAYMKRYNAMRENKAAEIDSVTRILNGQIAELDTQKAELTQTKTAKDREVSALSADESKQKKVYADLRTRESSLSRKIKAQQQEIQKAQQQIARIIAEESRQSNKTVRTAAEQRQITELSGRFDQNKGQLPYPVSGGVIVDSYGVHAHPTQKGLTVNNKGVNIAASQGAPVHAVFEGEVTRIFFFQGLRNNVMIRHGNYITVYSNLEKVSVKTGDKVRLNQQLGTLPTSGDADECYVHFEIWRETENLNPQAWFAR